MYPKMKNTYCCCCVCQYEIMASLADVWRHADTTALATVLDKESQPRTDDTNPRRHTKPEEEEEQQQQQYKPYNSNNSSNRSNGRKKKKTNAQGGYPLLYTLACFAIVVRRRNTRIAKRMARRTEKKRNSGNMQRYCFSLPPCNHDIVTTRSSRRELIRAFVNNQGSTNWLLKHKRKVIAPKKVISLPEATAPKHCKQENQVESFINRVKVSLSCYRYITDEVTTVDSCCLICILLGRHESVHTNITYSILQCYCEKQIGSYVRRHGNEASENVMVKFQRNLTEKADSNGNDDIGMEHKGRKE
ncbi:hypothetical protein M514_18484 [Trichuris suis]|uniref:Uncharacterized protein n=1 Tax=Trichuris suis TaxID=68888 RepID=A0A085NIN9_9BILA|nr:hypothetical protein M514_18484 [Trichuris suis]